MSQIHVDDIYDKTGSGRPEFPAGLTASGPVSIAGTLTYEDVTNVDAVGLVTARTGVRITAGGIVVTAGFSTLSDIKAGSGVTVLTSGNAEFVGIVTSNTCFKVGNGSFGPGIGVTITGDGNANLTGVITATSFDGNLTGTPTLGTGVTVYSSGIVSATTFDGNLTGDLTGNPVLGTGVTVYSSGIVSCTTINATSAVNINNKAAATTGKAIAMAMVFG